MRNLVRLAAIRETFEESGVLLLQSDSQDNVLSMEASKLVLWFFMVILCKGETAEWRLKVQEDPGKLLDLCRWSLDCVPSS